MSDPALFRPHALSRAPVIREGRLIRDLTMPEKDWKQFDEPTGDSTDPMRSALLKKFGRTPQIRTVSTMVSAADFQSADTGSIPVPFSTAVE